MKYLLFLLYPVYYSALVVDHVEGEKGEPRSDG